MLAGFPATSEETMTWQWSDIAPFYAELQNREINRLNGGEWLTDWNHLHRTIFGRIGLLRLAFDRNSADTAAKQALDDALENIVPPLQTAEHALTEKFLESGLESPDMVIPLQRIRISAATFRPENLPLQVEEEKLTNEYTDITGAQTVEWDGQELTVVQLSALQQETDRALRERAWLAASERGLRDRAALNDLWARLFRLRQRIATNAGESNYRDLIWKTYSRFDYRPDDTARFHEAIEQEVVPALERVYARRRAQMGVESLRPWDVEVDPLGRAPLLPFATADELLAKSETIFRHVDLRFGDQFATMRREGLIDPDNRKNKAGGAYSADLFINGKVRPFILMNSVGRDKDVATMLHEAGHAFHTFAYATQPYFQQQEIGSEIAEVGSMAMELLAAPYLRQQDGGFFNEADYARYRIAHLERILMLWPYIAIVDGFQNWAYTHPDAATDAAVCDETWGALWQRFRGGEDWHGLDDARVTGWHRKLHIFQIPFYYIEYGIAQLGAIQIWANALHDQSQAVADYQAALALGGTGRLPELYAEAGVRFALDAPTLHDAVALIEQTIADLSQA